jgi:hypothetical protein
MCTDDLAIPSHLTTPSLVRARRWGNHRSGRWTTSANSRRPTPPRGWYPHQDICNGASRASHVLNISPIHFPNSNCLAQRARAQGLSKGSRASFIKICECDEFATLRTLRGTCGIAPGPPPPPSYGEPSARRGSMKPPARAGAVECAIAAVTVLLNRLSRMLGPGVAYHSAYLAGGDFETREGSAGQKAPSPPLPGIPRWPQPAPLASLC